MDSELEGYRCSVCLSSAWWSSDNGCEMTCKDCGRTAVYRHEEFPENIAVPEGVLWVVDENG